MSRRARVLATSSIVGLNLLPVLFPSAAAQQVIEINGGGCSQGQVKVNGTCQYGSPSDYSGGGGSGSSGSIPENEAVVIAAAAAAAATTNVCTAKDISTQTKNTSSLSDVNLRWQAAENLYRAAAESMRGLTRKSIPEIFVHGMKVNSIYEVTYSDGAKESWYVRAGVWSNALIDEPLPGMKPPTKPPGSGCSAA